MVWEGGAALEPERPGFQNLTPVSMILHTFYNLFDVPAEGTITLLLRLALKRDSEYKEAHSAWHSVSA